MTSYVRNKMKITVAKSAGYCFGVRDAINMATDTAEKYGETYMLGSIVHNEKVVEDLGKVGVKIVDKLDEVPDNSPILFRAHGTVGKLWDEAKKRNMNIVDATCPLVYEIHKEVKMLEGEGRKIIVIGDHGQDEVIAIADQVDNPIIISNVEEAKKLRRMKYAGVVSQSTQMIENVKGIIDILIEKVHDLHFVNTICYPTRRNQEQLKELSKSHDVMIVVGSFTSANTKRLTELSLGINENTYQVTGPDDINTEWFIEKTSVGISAGASTPDYLIEEVKNKIEKL